MNIFEFAKKMELDGKQRYQEQYDKETNQGIKEILLLLINQEQHHYDMLSAMEKSNSNLTYNKSSFAGVKNLFEEMKDELDLVSKEHVKFYEMVLEIEKKSEAFYLKHADEQIDSAREILLMLADEEHNHAIIIENIIEFINKPQTWVDDAEFNQLSDY